MTRLTARWREALPDGVDGTAADHAAVDLVARWSQPHRVYHDLAHLTAVLRVVEEYADWATDLSAVRLAAWFHDAVYEHRTDNEEASAALAEAVLRRIGAPAALVAEVARLVRLTATHDPAPDDRNGGLLCDADLAILGAEPDLYLRYSHRIRREYAHVPPGTFRAGRVAVLRRLLARPVLYQNPAARDRWEARARENLRRELTTLAAPQPGHRQ